MNVDSVDVIEDDAGRVVCESKLSPSFLVGEARGLVRTFRVRGDSGGTEPVREPNDVDGPLRLNRCEKLFRLLCGESRFVAEGWPVVEALLEVVDCDHRFKFPTPSLALVKSKTRP